MNLNPVILAIPLFFGLIGIELAYEAISRKKTYRLNDAVTNINLGGLDQVSGVFMKLLKIGIYTLVFEQFAIFHLPQNTWSFVLLFILYDLCYYWSHRMAHEISLFWGGHVVHHQSEDYNLSVALRQSSTSFVWSFPFYLPLALIGFDPVQFVLIGGFNLIYQFWIHTEHIGKLPVWIEWFMNTPSHHRVHHGRDPKYIDKNYAGVFIIWDKMFGTFKEEDETPNYGITKPLNSWNPIYANFAHYLALFKQVSKTRRLLDAWKILVNKPGWNPDYLGGYNAPIDVGNDYHKYNNDTRVRGMKIYIFIQFIVLMAVSVFFLFNLNTLELTFQLLLAGWIAWSTLMLGWYFEVTNRWMIGLEVMRLILITVGIFWYNSPDFTHWTVLSAATFASANTLIFVYLIQKTQKAHLRTD